MELIAHPSTKSNIDSFLTSPSHGLLIAGAPSSGKFHVAKYIISNILGRPDMKLENYPFFKSLASTDEKELGIDDIREIKKFLRLKTTGSDRLRRFVVIDEAHNLGHEAQNAMLKLLEEPPDDTCIILTSSNPVRLKPTILSRLQTLRVRNIPKSQLQQISVDSEDIDRLYALSEGAIADVVRLRNKQQENEPSRYLKDAKELIGGTRLNRIIRLDKLAKDETYNLAKLLDGLYKIIDMKFKTTSNAGDDKKTAKLLFNKMEQIQYARKMLRQNVQPKLVLSKLFYEL